MDKTGREKHANKKGLLRLIVVAAFCCAFLMAVVMLGSESGAESSFDQKMRLLVAPPTWVSYVNKHDHVNGYELYIANGKALLGFESGDQISDLESFDGDDVPGSTEQITVAAGVFWTSPSEIKVQDGFLTDLDRDGNTEMILLVWKRGRFGKHRPFWITSDERCYSQHVFIYDVGDEAQEGNDGNQAGHDSVISGVVSQKWFASDIGVDVRRMKLLN